MPPRPFALLLIAILSVAACGGGSAASSAPATSAPPAPTVVPAPTSGTSAPAVTSAPAGPVAEASIVDYAFAPSNLTVSAGTTVTWENTDARAHTVTSTDGGFASSGTLSKGATYSVAFPSSGTFAYVCAFHPQMQATVTVTP